MSNSYDADEIEVQRTELRDGHVRVRYRVGDKELDVEGPPDYVNEHATVFLRQVVGYKANQDTSAQNENDVPMLLRSADTSPQTEPTGPAIDLIQFYLQKAPKDQGQQVLVLTYYYHHILGKETLSLEDYTEAYRQLQRAAVPMPPNMKSTVRNVVDRTNLLYNPERGQFQLTIPGEQLVEQLPE